MTARVTDPAVVDAITRAYLGGVREAARIRRLRLDGLLSARADRPDNVIDLFGWLSASVEHGQSTSSPDESASRRVDGRAGRSLGASAAE